MRRPLPEAAEFGFARPRLSTRYWPTFAPLMALAGVLLVETARASGLTDAAVDARPRAQALARLLGRLQVTIAGGVLLLLGSLVSLALLDLTAR